MQMNVASALFNIYVKVINAYFLKDGVECFKKIRSKFNVLLIIKCVTMFICSSF